MPRRVAGPLDAGASGAARHQHHLVQAVEVSLRARRCCCAHRARLPIAINQVYPTHRLAVARAWEYGMRLCHAVGSLIGMGRDRQARMYDDKVIPAAHVLPLAVPIS